MLPKSAVIMDDHGHKPPSLPPPTHPVTPQVIQPIQPSLGIMATMVFQDGTVNEHSKHITTAAHRLAKSFFDGDANFILDIASIDRFLSNYIFDSFEDKVKAFQEAATKFKHLGYSIMANGFVNHEKLSRSLSPLTNMEFTLFDQNTTDIPPIFGNNYGPPLTHSAPHPIKQESPSFTPHLSSAFTPCLAPASFPDHNTTSLLDYIETPWPMLPVNATILDQHSPTAPPIMLSNITDDYNHITSEIVLVAPVDSRLTLPMDIDRQSPVAAKILSCIGIKWMTCLTNASDPNLSYPDMAITSNYLQGPAKTLMMDGSTKN
ncbi:hypothetical protein AX17_006045 [Amanita inopinata Kibby_2008]|nr:hypothetical protein AX17_006045 [Amanita inopinata Kibby_2008]